MVNSSAGTHVSFPCLTRSGAVPDAVIDHYFFFLHFPLVRSFFASFPRKVVPFDACSFFFSQVAASFGPIVIRAITFFIYPAADELPSSIPCE